MNEKSNLSKLAESKSLREGFVTVATGADAARLGHELLEQALGPDLLTAVLNGRPPLGDVWRSKGHRSPMFTFRLPDELADKFRAIVAKEGRAQSEVLRQAVSDYVAQHR